MICFDVNVKTQVEKSDSGILQDLVSDLVGSYKIKRKNVRKIAVPAVLHQVVLKDSCKILLSRKISL